MQHEDAWDLYSEYDDEDHYYDYEEDAERIKREIDAEVKYYTAVNKKMPITYTTAENLGIDLSQYGPPPKRYGVSRTMEDYEWAHEVKRRDNHTCQACGIRGVPMHAHHLESYAWNRELRLDLNNGITLCIHCHRDFHDACGRRNNTREQFERWLATTYG